MIVFDITSKSSYEAVNAWRKEALLYSGKQEHVRQPIIVVGNKLDLFGKRVVVEEDARLNFEDQKMKYAEVSAKDGKSPTVSPRCSQFLRGRSDWREN